MSLSQQEAFQLLSDQRWRLSHLYKIKDKEGNVVDFEPNWAQLTLLDPHNLNIVLKARACALSLRRGGTSHQLTTWNYHFPRVAFSGLLPFPA